MESIVSIIKSSTIKLAKIRVRNPVLPGSLLSLARRCHCLKMETETVSETSHFYSEFTRMISRNFIIFNLLESVEYSLITSMFIK
jgi:hypothetical protein